MSMLKNVALVLVLCAAALPAPAKETFPASQGLDGKALLDPTTYREMALRQRLWDLQDQRRRVEGDFLSAAIGLQSAIGGSQVRANKLGFRDEKNVRDEMMKRDAASLSSYLGAAIDRPFSNEQWELKNGVIARTQMESIDVQIKALTDEIAAIKGSR